MIVQKKRDIKMTLKDKWKKIGRWIYGAVGLTALISFIWAVIKISHHAFFQTMGFFGSIGFIILTIGGLNWGIKAIFGKDLFLN